MIGERPILVTGAHRSGTTWVGRMLALTPQVGYIGEPFSPICRPGVCTAGFKLWFTHVPPDEPNGYYEPLLRTLSFRYDVAAELRTLGMLDRPAASYTAEELQMLAEYSRFAAHHAAGSLPLMKDPIAIFSAEWLAQAFGMRVLVLIRHPAAFAGSLKKLNWRVPFKHLLDQPRLMEGYLAPFHAEIDDFFNHQRDIVAGAGLFWKCVYHTVEIYRQRHPDWIFLRHEDLSADPTSRFRELYERLNLHWSPDIESQVAAHSRPGNPADWSPDNPHTVALDSRAALKNWRQRLTGDEVQRLRDIVEPVASLYYSDTDWR